MLSESIALREEGRTHWVSVVVNGKHTQEMVLDSGASLISLPLAMAEKFGIHPSSKDQKILVTLADGREIEAWKMTLTSVRVGKFTVENVECAVLAQKPSGPSRCWGCRFWATFSLKSMLRRGS